MRPLARESCIERFSSVPEKMTAGKILRMGGKLQKSYTVAPVFLMKEAATKMSEQQIGSLVVVDSDQSVLGMLTDRDVLRAVSGDNWQKLPVSSCMTPIEKIITVTSSDLADECLQIMALKGFRHLPVLSDQDQSVLGVLSMKDVVRATWTGQDGIKSAFLKNINPRQGLRSRIQNCAQSLILVSAAHSIPHPAKQSSGGEDAHFVFNYAPSDAKGHSFSAIGVADGVGSNSFEHGIDAAAFPRGLMGSQPKMLNAYNWTSGYPTPYSMLKHAIDSVVEQKAIGSSTACIVTLSSNDEQRLRAINVGDSGFYILRDISRPSERRQGTMHRVVGKVSIVYRSAQQLHDFNWPLQLGYGADSSRFDTIQQAEVIEFHVEEGDIIILATDGLFDNVTEDEILNVVDFDEPVERICKKLATRAYERSLDRRTDSPFALLAKENDIMWGGGRPDDITVIVSRVNLASSKPEVSLR
jgi:protein phosphatase PTC7